ncbi:hypothetical protein RND81_05G192700 [Saponaria officinalis]|uniref:mannan endo-1,4-beta-mannosidase n=1 Tax=Saponaria officinalis TaxID=3572 RepID=A0AAW1KU80_SAPOF
MMMMNSQCREKFLYPIIGITVTITIIYFSLDQHFDFPMVLWQKNMGFIGVDSTRFMLKEDPKSTPVYVNGWNSYWLLEAPSKEKVSRMFKKGAQMGLNVCRTWAFSDGPGPNSLQISPGVFNEKALKELDYVIVEARKNRIRLILSLVNNLNVFGGKDQYVKWAKEAGVDITSSADPFFADSTIKGYYKSYIKAIITRRNSLSGVKYSKEPAIFAWELINEPRCDSNTSSSILQAWITEMAAYTKSLDQNHLVTVGLEGFYSSANVEKSEVNPGEWAGLFGTDFIQNSAVDGIDFASVHLYPDSWMPHANNTEKMNFISKWTDSHISDAENTLKKPVLFTEVGCPSDVKNQGVYDRNALFTTVYDKIFESAKKGQAGAGAMIWQLMVEDMDEYGDRFSLVAWNEPTIYNLILKQSCRLRSILWKPKDLDRKDPCYGFVP